MKRVWLVSFSVVALLGVNAVTTFAQNLVKSGTGAVQVAGKVASAVKPIAVPKVKVPAAKLPKASVPVAPKLPTTVPHVAVPAAPRTNTTAFTPGVSPVNISPLSKSRLQTLESQISRTSVALANLRADVAENGTIEQHYLFNKKHPLSEQELFKYYEDRIAKYDADLSFDKAYEFAFNNFPLLVASYKPYLSKDAEFIVKRAEFVLDGNYGLFGEPSFLEFIKGQKVSDSRLNSWAHQMAAATTMGMFGNATNAHGSALLSAYGKTPLALQPVSQVVIGRALLSMGDIGRLKMLFDFALRDNNLYKDFWQGIQEYAEAHNIPFDRSYHLKNYSGKNIVVPDYVREVLVSRGALNKLHLDPSVTATEDWMFIIHNKGKAK